MQEVAVETTVKLHGSADAVIELDDNWEGMALMSIRIGCHDGTGEIAWSCEPLALGWDMVDALGAQLTKMANDRKDKKK